MTMGEKISTPNNQAITNNSSPKNSPLTQLTANFIYNLRINIKGSKFGMNFKSEIKITPSPRASPPFRSSNPAPPRCACRSPSIPRRAGSSSSCCHWQLLPQAAAAAGCSRGCNGARRRSAAALVAAWPRPWLLLGRDRGPNRASPARLARRHASPAVCAPRAAQHCRERECVCV